MTPVQCTDPSKIDFVPIDIMSFSCEAHFYFSATVNTQNCRSWTRAGPRKHHQQPLYGPKVTVGCTIHKFDILGPYLFEEEGKSITVNSILYSDILQIFFQPQLDSTFNVRGVESVWFQQDGTNDHTSICVLAALR
ncbi:transposable element Tc3 transposase [Nephila pilipes]|uniref:Transposable element Tc3 transposase n=1 Tax=Nephila pilipes TaxID=299642 RepID=A0A8X6NAE7_NEPPI|nr:transposable element Tc3 transposase [Nephila pilipes]